MNKQSWTIAVVFSLATGFASAAYAAPQCGMNTGQPATGEPIPIGAITTASGGPDLSPGTKGAQAYFDCVNANGGIHGRPIKYIVEDDQLQPPKDLELAKKLVEDDKVVALVGSSSVVDCLTNAQYFAEKNIISLMGAGVTPACFNSTHIAPLNLGPRLGVVAEGMYAVQKLGAKSLVFSMNQLPGTDWIGAGPKEWAEANGIPFSFVQYDVISTDNDSWVAQILQSGAEASLNLGTPPDIIPFLAAAEAQNAAEKVKFLAPTPVYHPVVPKAIGDYWNGRFWVALEFAPVNSDGPDVKNYNEVIATYYKGDDSNSLSQGGYLAARIATEALLTLDPAKIDRDSVTAAIQNVQNFTSDHLCNPWSFGPKDAPRHVPNRGARIAVVKDGGWEVGECFTVEDKGTE